MAIQINRVDTDIDVAPPAAGAAAASGPGGSDAALKERIRPIVMQILQEELDRLRRKQG
jgi:hypothetical protein